MKEKPSDETIRRFTERSRTQADDRRRGGVNGQVRRQGLRGHRLRHAENPHLAALELLDKKLADVQFFYFLTDGAIPRGRGFPIRGSTTSRSSWAWTTER
jgi:hypothetical protein